MEEIRKVIDTSAGKQIAKSAYELLEDDNLFDLGLTSIGFISIIVELEQRFDIIFEEDDLDLGRFNTLIAIKRELDKKLEMRNLDNES